MISYKKRSELERIAVRLFTVTGDCEDPALQHKLMELAEELVKVIEEMGSVQLTEFD